MVIERNELRVVRECKTVGYHGGNGEEVTGFHGVFLAFPSARTFNKQAKRAGNDVERFGVLLVEMTAAMGSCDGGDIVHLLPVAVYQLRQRASGIAEFKIGLDELNEHIRSSNESR